MTSLFGVLKAGAGVSIEYLDVSYNPIGELGVHTIADAISNGYLPKLKHLILRQV
jgi:hypothetical protein